MFTNVGWGEILVLFIVGLVLIGPERLPKLIADVRAMILAARTAIDDAKQSLAGEFGEDFDELRKPLEDIGQLRSLNPRTAITRTLFDGDDTYLDLLSGKPAAGGDASEARGAGAAGQTGTTSAGQAPAVSPAAVARPAQTAPEVQHSAPASSRNPSDAAPAEQPQQTSWVDDDVL
ncbi:Sec-independent protein translocase protein TatB [Corynebacterium sp. H78]|uniref:Sec-independent protein translocase protein TatB n=1 Tax=Corynebacterium sp. H78 TaxID=3133417 RepID=UPI0030AB588A